MDENKQNSGTLESILKYGTALVIGGAVVIGLSNKNTIDSNANTGVLGNQKYINFNVGGHNIYIVGGTADSLGQEAIQYQNQQEQMKYAGKNLDKLQSQAQDSTYAGKKTIGWFKALNEAAKARDARRGQEILDGIAAYKNQ